MVTISAPMRAQRAGLARMLAARDASLRLERPGPLLLLRRGVRTLRSVTALVIVAAMAFVSRHGLVLGGLTAFVIAAWTWAAIAGMITLGVSLLFLEVRRK